MNKYRLSRFEFERVANAITSLMANQPVASESVRARDQCQSAVVTPSANLSFSFPSGAYTHLIDFIAKCNSYITVSIGHVVVSDIAVCRLVDNRYYV